MPLNDEDRTTLSAYLDGELDDEAVQQLEARLSRDPEARAEYEAMRRAWGLLDYLPRASPSSDMTHRTMERLARETQVRPRRTTRRRRWPVVVAWAAAVLIAAGAGYLVGGRIVTHTTEIPDPDEPLVRQLRVIEYWPLYQHADDLDFVRQLDQPDLFGDDLGT
jgi:anti-sigma factor RsiW